MKISEKLKEKQPLITFEIFPPKTDSPVSTIYETIDDLYNLNPDFMSVTYGAGGSTKDKTVEISSYIQNKYNLTSLAHITCVTTTKAEIDLILKSLENEGIQNIMALRGDYPTNPDIVVPEDRFMNSVELIEHIKNTTDFCIGAACYPEKHPEAKDLDADIDFLKRKQDAGADFFTTQMFFDNEAFYDFYEKASNKGIRVPIFTGIMPILSKRQVAIVNNLTGNTVPRKLLRVLERYEDDPAALREAGMAYAISQIIELLSWGVDGVHIYTMNKPDTAKTILNSITAIRNVLTSLKWIWDGNKRRL